MIDEKRTLLCLIDHLSYTAGRIQDNIDDDDGDDGTTLLTNREAHDLVGRLDCAVTLLCSLAEPDKHSVNVRQAAADWMRGEVAKLPL